LLVEDKPASADSEDESSKRRKLLQEALELDRDDSEDEGGEKVKQDGGNDGSEEGRYAKTTSS
jgi:protein CWC15